MRRPSLQRLATTRYRFKRRLPWPCLIVALIFTAGAPAGAPLKLPAETDAEADATGKSSTKDTLEQTHGRQPEEQDGLGLLRTDGAFGRLWNQRFFIGPGVLSCPQPAQAPHARFRLPADFEKHQAIVLAGGWLAPKAPEVLTAIVREARKRTPLVLLVSSAAEQDRIAEMLAKRGLPEDAVRFLKVSTDSGWVRDFGPIFLCTKQPALGAVDAAYGKPEREHDDAAGAAIARAFGVEPFVTTLVWHGGNLLSNGQGLLVTTTQSINANIEFGVPLHMITRFAGDRFGVKQIVVLEHLVGETTGHVDMFACFTSPNTILLGKYSASVDPVNAALLDRNAARLAKVRMGRDKLTVARIPMPSNADGIWRTYTNALFARGRLLVPTYPDVDPTGGRRALAIYRRILPGWEVQGIDCSDLARHQGGLRCLSTYVPKVKVE